MKAQRCSTRAGIAAAAVAAGATAWALDPLEFVGGWPIEVPDGAEVFDVPLSPQVYAGIDGLDQLAVLDANGTPQAFFRASTPQQTAEQRAVLEASPSRRSTSAARKCAMRACSSARGRAATTASRRAARSPIGICCARRSSAPCRSPRRPPLASLGERRELGGEAALVPERGFPWSTAALRTALLAGVLVALAMAVRLVREMSRQSP